MKKIFFLLLSASLIIGVSSCKKNKKADAQEQQEQTTDTVSYEDAILLFDDTDTIMEQDTAEKAAATNDQLMVEDTTTGKVVPVTSKPDISKEGKKIYIIVGSYQNYSNAVKAQQKFKQLGYDAQILPKVGKFNRVAIMSFDSEVQARTKLKELRKKFKRPDFWLLLK